MFFFNENGFDFYFDNAFRLKDKWIHTFEQPIHDWMDYFADYIIYKEFKPCKRILDNFAYTGKKYITLFLFSQIPLLEGKREKETVISLALSSECIEFHKNNDIEINKQDIIDLFLKYYLEVDYKYCFLNSYFKFFPGKNNSSKGQEHIFIFEKTALGL